MAKKGKFAAHTFRVGGRVGDRAKKFVKDARLNSYSAGRLAEDVAASAVDAVDFWTGLFGTGSSLPILELTANQAGWKASAGVANTVVLDDPVPADATWPDGAGSNPLLKLVGVGTYTATNVEFVTTSVVDDQRVEWRFVFRDTGSATLPVGEYTGILAYKSTLEGPALAAIVRAAVT